MDTQIIILHSKLWIHK